MVDIHTHIIFGTDDGSDTIEESVAILKSAYEAEVTDIILTPHFIDVGKGSYNNIGVNEKFRVLKERILEEGIDIKLYLGNEIMVYGNITEILENTDAKTLADSKYMLIEFPMNTGVSYVLETIYEINIRGLIPIIAHPERCECFQKDYKLIREAIDEGAYIQMNMDSISGRYGNEAKKMAKRMLKDDMVHFLATDTHTMKRNAYLNMEETNQLIDKMIGRFNRKKLTVYNQRKLFLNEYIEK